MKTLSAIRETARQLLRDEFQTSVDYEFADDELDIHINEVLTEISQYSPYEAKETVVADGTTDISLSAITNLIGDKVVEVEYPTGSVPPSFINDFTIFGNTVTLNTKPTSGANIYLYCHKVHSLTESASSLTADLEGVLIKGTVAKAAQAWLNGMRAQIVPSSQRWYQGWADRQLMIYQASLDSITRPRVWKY